MSACSEALRLHQQAIKLLNTELLLLHVPSLQHSITFVGSFHTLTVFASLKCNYVYEVKCGAVEHKNSLLTFQGKKLLVRQKQLTPFKK